MHIRVFRAVAGAFACLAASAGAVTPLNISVSTTTAQSQTAILNQFAGAGTTSFAGTTGSTAFAPAALASFDTRLGILTGARVTVSVPYTLTVIALAPTVPSSGSGRTVDVNTTISAALSLAGASITGASFTATPKCNSGDCLNGSSNNTQSFSGTFSGTAAISAANLAQLASSGAGTVSFGSTVFGTNTTLINGSGIPALNPDGSGGGGARTIMTLGGTTTAQNQYSIEYDYLKRSTPSFSPSTVQTSRTIDLGTRFAGDGPVTQGFTIANIGDANTAATRLVATARSTNDSRFSTSLTTLDNLAAGAQQDFSIAFNPATAGTFTDTFTFTMQDDVAGGVGLVSTPLTLTTTARVINRALPSFDPVARLLDQTLDFGNVDLRAGPVTLNFALYNQGDGNSAGLQLLSTTGNNQPFSTSLTALANLAGGQSQQFTVTLAPTAPGVVNSVISFLVSDYAPGVTGTPRQTTLTINAIANVFDPVPEPQSWAMLIAGFGLIGTALRRQRQARETA